MMPSATSLGLDKSRLLRNYSGRTAFFELPTIRLESGGLQAVHYVKVALPLVRMNSSPAVGETSALRSPSSPLSHKLTAVISSRS